MTPTDRRLLAWLAGALEPDAADEVEAALDADPTLWAHLVGLRAELDVQPTATGPSLPPPGLGWGSGFTATPLAVMGARTVEVQVPALDADGAVLLLAVDGEVFEPVFPTLPAPPFEIVAAREGARVRLTLAEGVGRLVAVVVPAAFLGQSWEAIRDEVTDQVERWERVATLML